MPLGGIVLMLGYAHCRRRMSEGVLLMVIVEDKSGLAALNDT